MGNRANVVFESEQGTISPCVYLHWNGGAESIYPFLDELDKRQVRADGFYDAARFVQLVGEFFDPDTLSLGITNGPSAITPEALAKVQTDPGDNGFYIVTKHGEGYKVRRFKWKGITARTFWELTPEQVEAERAAAYAHDYNTGEDTIAARFDRIRESKAARLAAEKAEKQARS